MTGEEGVQAFKTTKPKKKPKTNKQTKKKTNKKKQTKKDRKNNVIWLQKQPFTSEFTCNLFVYMNVRPVL